MTHFSSPHVWIQRIVSKTSCKISCFIPCNHSFSRSIKKLKSHWLNTRFSDWLTSKASLKAAICSFVNSADIFNFSNFSIFQKMSRYRVYMGKIVGKSHDLLLALKILIYVCRHFPKLWFKSSKCWKTQNWTWMTFNDEKSKISQIQGRKHIQTVPRLDGTQRTRVDWPSTDRYRAD